METMEKLRKERLRSPHRINSSCALLVDNISYRTTPDDLFPLFDKCGTVVDIYIPRSQRTGKCRGYAFVRYQYADEARIAVNMLSGKEVNGREIGVKFADRRRNSDNISKRTPLSSDAMLTPKERTSFYIEKYMPMATKALYYYNSKQNTNMKLVEVCVAFKNDKCVHINFTATSDIAKEDLLLFAELRISFNDNDDCVLSVEGCCVLEQVDCGNPLGRGCRLCPGELIHPGPRDGYRIVSGDCFEGHNFWDYRPCAYDESKMYCSPLCSDWQMFHDCATKAFEYFNLQQRVKFRDMKVVAGVHQIDKIYEVERKIHVNFTAQSRSSKELELFFAELIVPLFEYEVSSWDHYKADFIQVKGCCKLKRVDYGNPFGRKCGLCCGRVKHPGPTYGYCAEAGDQFKDAEFWNIGLGIF